MSRVVYTNTADTIDQEPLRAAHNVRLVSDAEEGMPVHSLPGGVYGFTYSPGLPNAPLFATRRYRSYEIHKVVTGETFVVAFADAETAAQLDTASSEVTIRVQPEPASGAAVLVKIPYSQIRHHRQYAAPNQDGFVVTLAGLV
jgi:hypothetical protein